ncbi:MAG: trigger factor [Burkholderiales bacterium]|nr:trigger factor [Burkholderiales bacterium]
MAATVETVSALERRINLSIPAEQIEKEVASRLQRMSRTVRMQGFRPGKVPLRMVASTYGPQVRSEVIGDAIQKNFSETVTAQNLRVAGYPRIEPKVPAEGAANDAAFEFVATFEVYPDVVVGDLSALAIERAATEVQEADVDRTVETLRKQRIHYAAVDRPSRKGDRLTVDFAGSIDGVPFDGGSAKDFAFELGGGQMLPEFDAAGLDMTVGGEKTFDLAFPADYQGKEVAGKTAQFTISVKKVEEGTLPVLDADFARSLGIADGDVAKMRADIRANLEREVKKRLQARLKSGVMQALYESVKLDAPKALIAMDIERLIEQARADLAQRGVKEQVPLPNSMFEEQAKRRVSLGLILNELVKANGLAARPEQVRAVIDEFAQSYEDPAEVVRWYYSDKQRLADVEALALEENVVAFVLSKAKVTDKTVPFEELMGRG